MNMTLIYADRSRYEFRFVKTKKVIQNFFITAIHQTLVYTFKVGLCVAAVKNPRIQNLPCQKIPAVLS
jgi:signal recognition particle subunit SEC65